MTRTLICHPGWSVVAAAFVFFVQPAASSAREAAASAVQRVQVYPSYYKVGGKRFTELDGLEGWVKSTGVRALEFHSCMWTATERLAAAIERLHCVYLDVRWVEAGKDGCPSAAGEAASRTF